MLAVCGRCKASFCKYVCPMTDSIYIWLTQPTTASHVCAVIFHPFSSPTAFIMAEAGHQSVQTCMSYQKKDQSTLPLKRRECSISRTGEIILTLFFFVLDGRGPLLINCLSKRTINSTVHLKLHNTGEEAYVLLCRIIILWDTVR